MNRKNVKIRILALAQEVRRFQLPKKGRIRLILLAALLAFFGLLLARRDDPPRVSEGPSPAGRREPPADAVRFIGGQPFDTTFLSSRPFAQGADTSVIRLHTDDRLQRRIFSLMTRYHPRCGAAVVFKPRTGEVLAAVSYRNEAEGEHLPALSNMLFWNEYPAASLFKIVTAAGAMEYGLLNPDDRIGVTGNYYTLYRYQLKDGPARWMRHLSLREAFSRSVNPLFGKIGLQVLGSQRLNETAERFLFNRPIRFDLPLAQSHYVPPRDEYETAALACGFNSTTTISPVHAALIAGAMASGGTVHGPVLIRSVEGTDKNRWEGSPDTLYRLASPATADRTRTIMEEVVRQGTARKSFASLRRLRAYEGLRMGGKTGSLDSVNPRGRCDWFAGFALDPSDPDQVIAMAVVTVHGAFWTVHSSFIAAEAIREWFDPKRSAPAVRRGGPIAPLSDATDIGRELRVLALE